MVIEMNVWIVMVAKYAMNINHCDLLVGYLVNLLTSLKLTLRLGDPFAIK